MTESIPGRAVYVDANPFMYLVEGNDGDATPINELFARLRSQPGSAVTSELTLAEVLAKTKLPKHRRTYLELIVWSKIFDLQPVSREILVETASYRKASVIKLGDGKESMVKLPDAIHIVTAIRAQCPRLLSNDGKLRLPAGMKLIRPDSEGIAALIRELL